VVNILLCIRKRMNMSDLIIVKDNELFVGTWKLSQGFEVEHRALTRLIKRYKSEFDELGITAIPLRQIRSQKRGKPFDEYLLCEEQAIYITTLLTNNSAVRKFKMKLSKEFVKQRRAIEKLLGAIRNNKQNAEWLEARNSGKLARKEQTDALKALAQYQMLNGSENAEKVYVNYSIMVNKAIFGNEVRKVKGKNLRDCIDVSSLNILKVADDMVARIAYQEVEKKTEYHQIYKICKEKMEKFADFIGRRQIEMPNQLSIT
jgi:phage regulator Rha-like protein